MDNEVDEQDQAKTFIKLSEEALKWIPKSRRFTKREKAELRKLFIKTMHLAEQDLARLEGGSEEG